MRHTVLLLSAALVLALSASNAGAQVQGVCVSGCNIPNPSPTPMQAPPVDLSRTFHFQAVQGDLLLREATRPTPLPAIGQINTPIREGTSLLTGPSGGAQVSLQDGTTLSVGPNTELAITRVTPASNGDLGVGMTLVKGFIRWAHRTWVGESWAERERRLHPGVVILGGTSAIRGTDVEMNVEPDGSGYIRLYEGSVDYTDPDSGQVIELRPGQTLRFANFRVAGVE